MATAISLDRTALTSHAERQPALYVPALDGLRFCAFLLVFLHHVHALPLGWVGVDLFLCLSAYLLTTLLLVERERTGRVHIGRFYVRRALRIWPLYAVMLLAGFVALPLIYGLSAKYQAVYAGGALWREHLIPYLLFLGNWSVGIFGYPGNVALDLLWTVSLEEQFYLLLPLVLASLTRPAVARVAIGAILITLCVRWWMVFNHLPTTAIYAITISRLDAFGVGMLLAVHSATVSAWARALHVQAFLVAVVAACGVLVVWTGDQNVPGPHLVPLYLLTAIGAGSAVVLALASRAVARVLASRPLVYLGKISYGLYVTHLAVLLVVGSAVRHAGATAPLAALISLAATIAIAAVSYRVLERPFLRLKERFTVVPSRPV